MSFILEALRKSEAERRAAPMPRGTATGVYVVATSRRTAPLVWWVSAGLLAAAIGIAVGWGAASRGSKPDAPDSRAPVATPVAAASGSSAADMAAVDSKAAADPRAMAGRQGGGGPLKPVAKASGTPPAPQPPAVTVVRLPVRTVIAASATSPVPAANTPVATTPVAIAPARSAPSPAALPIGDRIAMKSTQPVRPTPSSVTPLTPAATVSPATASAPAATAATVTDTAPLALPGPAGDARSTAAVPMTPPAALPASTSLSADEPPKLAISGFANAEDTRARFAVIDNRIVREGETFAPDLRLVQVGDDGIVVEYKGRRYRP